MAECLPVLGGFSVLLSAVQRCRECLNVVDDLRSREADLSRTGDCIRHLQLRYSVLVDKMLFDVVTGPEELETIKDEPGRGAEAERRMLENLSDELQVKCLRTVRDLKDVMSDLQEELRFDEELPRSWSFASRLKSSTRRDEKHLMRTFYWTSPGLLDRRNEERRQKIISRRPEREALLERMEKLVQSFGQLTPAKSEKATKSQASWEGVYYDMIGDVFPRLRKFKNRWLRVRLTRACDVRRRYVQFLGGHHASVNSDENYVHLDMQPHFKRKMSPTPSEKVWPKDLSPRIEHPRQPSLQVPPLPARLHEDFRCPYCQVVMSFDNEEAWKLHVFADLRAYVCTAQSCGLLMFQDRREWMQHELEAHLAEQPMPISRIEGPFTALESSTELSNVPISPRRRQGDSYDRDMSDSVPYPSCGFCSYDTLESLKEYEEHVGSHLEQVALLAIDSTLEAPRPLHEHTDYDLKTPLPKTTIDLEKLLSLTEGLQLLHRYRIALAIASSHLMLHTTSWVGDMWRGQEVVFEMIDGNLRIDCPYLKRDIDDEEQWNQSQLSRHSTADNTLIPLGIVLLELFFGTTLEESRPRKRFEEEGKVGFVHDWAAALIWADDLEGQAGPECAHAVRYCLNKRLNDSANTYWRQELHDFVITPVRFSYEAMAMP